MGDEEHGGENAGHVHAWPFLAPHRPGWRWGVESSTSNRAAIRHLVHERISEEPLDHDCATCTNLAAVEAVARLRSELDRELGLLVTTAHAHGATWAELGRALGCSRQSAHERYKDHVHSTDVYDQLFSDLQQAMTRAQELSLSRDTPPDVAEEAFELLEQQEDLDNRNG